MSPHDCDFEPNDTISEGQLLCWTVVVRPFAGHQLYLCQVSVVVSHISLLDCEMSAAGSGTVIFMAARLLLRS